MSRSGPLPTYPTVLGTPIPENTPHAVSVTLPTWADNVAYEEGEARVLSALRSGYPRFVYHEEVQNVMAYCERKFATSNEACLPFPTRRVASECRDFIVNHFQVPAQHPPSKIRIAEFAIQTTHNPYSPQADDPTTAFAATVSLYIVLFPVEAKGIAKSFWQHSGEGLSSRLAEYCMKLLTANEHAKEFATPMPGVRAANPRYRVGSYGEQSQQDLATTTERRAARGEQDLFVEERFGRNLDPRLGQEAKVALRKRIAGVLGDENEVMKDVGQQRGIGGVSEEDVFLFPTGMSAIYNAHRVVRHMRPNLKSVQYGFPYLDTLKIQEKFGPGVHFLGHGTQGDLDDLEVRILLAEDISSVFCEFPSNPLLRTPNLARLRALADEHGFLIVVDETVGNFVNVHALKWADMVVSSLTKIFSGDSNVMGGSAVLNPQSPHYAAMKAAMHSLYEDNLFSLDAVFLERNSRTFRNRIARINQTAEQLCDFLQPHPKIKTIYYPKYVDASLYHDHARPNAQGRYGYGGLFSVILHSDDAAQRFFDVLNIAKGPSLGTNFTLGCPYTIIAHYGELDWARSYGVETRLIRISVGLEDLEVLKVAFDEALNFA
ncbi:hypothetical protein HDU85_002508 [Gaertneriomyces sp. JEL0708]|nr:hypothetical protein HDU85_002508 [Gaertneriomyces sp. JEL0708]